MEDAEARGATIQRLPERPPSTLQQLGVGAFQQQQLGAPTQRHIPTWDGHRTGTDIVDIVPTPAGGRIATTR